MSHDVHGAAHASADELPRGTITMGVKLLVVAGVLASIMQGLFVGCSSGYGRVWPAADSVKLELPPANLSH